MSSLLIAGIADSSTIRSQGRGMTFQFFFNKTKIVTVLLFIAAVLLLPVRAHAGIEEHITKTESGFYYTVQKGDTLWDLSKKFADSPWQWPNLWHYNPNIKNPHLIYPGEKILIYKKSWAEKPTQPAVTKKAPEQQKYISYTKINTVGFIRKEPVTPCGTIFKNYSADVVIGTDDMVYVRVDPKGCGLAKGELYTIYRTIGPIVDPSGDDIGTQYYFTGVAKITSIESGYAIAHIQNAYREVRINDMLMPLQKRPEEIPLRKSVPGLNGSIIKCEDEHRVLVGQDEIMFINKGEADGVKPGQRYWIYLQQEGQVDPQAPPVTLAKLDVGRLLVLLTEKHTATVLITNATRTIESGMEIGTVKAVKP